MRLRLVPQRHDLLVQLIVLRPVVLNLGVQLLDLDLLAVHLREVRPQTNFTLQVSDLSVLPLNVFLQRLKLAQKILEVVGVILQGSLQRSVCRFQLTDAFKVDLIASAGLLLRD